MHATTKRLMTVHVDTECGWSGGEEQVFILLEGLRERGHRSILACPPGSRCEAEAEARGLETRALPLERLGALSGAGVRALFGLRRLFRESGCDLVHLHTGRASWLGGLAAWGTGVPALATRRMDRRVRPFLDTRFLYGSLLRRTAAISPAVAERLHEGGVDPGRIATIPSSVDPTRLAPIHKEEETRSALGTPTDSPVLLSVAALVRRKGLDVLLGALAQLAQRGLHPILWVAGEGPERSALERQRRELGLDRTVRFLGRRDDVPDLVAACDVFVLPSRQEGLGVAALEAMAGARPVVASRVGGLGEAVIDDRTGLLVPPADVDALARALTRLLRDPALRERLGAEGPARIAEGYHAEQMVAAYESLYFDVLGREGSA